MFDIMENTFWQQRIRHFLMNKWKYYFVNLWQCFFSVWFQSQKVNINQLSKDNLEFLGYLSSLRLKTL
uniref:Maturase MatK N-terminal domain-containing protein n=1 Tax=Brassica campestris TaxID=3711 RepID=A0A3P6DBD7_BRACM|nr:unnamed protein product [Brassica rapa]